MAKRTLALLISRLDNLEKDLQQKAPSIILGAGRSFLVAKKLQIANSGVGRYSSKKYHPSALKGRELSSAGKTFIENKISRKEKTNWSELRRAEGLQVSFVDLYYSGQMMNSTIAQKANQASFTYFITIGARNKKAQEKLNYNYERYGNFLKPTQAQFEEMKKDVNRRVLNIIIQKLK